MSKKSDGRGRVEYFTYTPMSVLFICGKCKRRDYSGDKTWKRIAKDAEFPPDFTCQINPCASLKNPYGVNREGAHAK